MCDMRRRLASIVHSGALWTADMQFKSGHLEAPTCRFCGAETEDLIHFLWECPRFESVRDAAFPKHRSLDPRNMPASLAMHALPPDLVIGCGVPFWGPGMGEGSHGGAGRI
eukprot:3511681-Alexandrium_andersonii.AAC.1